MYAQARLLVLSYRGYVKREDPGFKKKEREGGGGLVYGDGAWLGERYRDMSHLSRESSKHA